MCARRKEVIEQACSEIKDRTGVKILAAPLDITKTDQIKAVTERVMKELGRIDILVNNAAMGGSEKPLINPKNPGKETTEADWDATVATNLRGVFVLSQAVVKKMIEKGEGGKVINLSSMVSIIGMANMAAYCACKAAGHLRFAGPRRNSRSNQCRVLTSRNQFDSTTDFSFRNPTAIAPTRAETDQKRNTLPKS